MNLPGHVPGRVKTFRIDLAELDMIAQPDQAVGQENVIVRQE